MAQCMYPYSVERQIYHNQNERWVSVPCGKCPNCLRRRSASWTFRLEVEALLWETQHFVTLTYNTDHVPISENSFMTLRKEDLTNFFKALRKKTSGKLKYYAVGEYGTNNKRPHFHLILFGDSDLTTEHIITSWRDLSGTKQQRGDVYFGKVEAASIRYCVQYYNKGIWHRSHKNDDRVPEYSVMSQGIGKNFLTDAQIKHLLDNPDQGYIYDRQGHKIAIPRYFKKRLFDYVIPEKYIHNHPSYLVHRDEMLDRKEVHTKEMKILIDSLPKEEDNENKNEDRKQAILNFRQKHRKTRK